ncbi:MAG: LPS export ABC transporter periplasmic protein LptC [Sphingomonadaceae bacterium]
MLDAVARSPRQRRARPGGVHDFVVRVSRIILPSAVGVLGVMLALAPLGSRGDISFILSKDGVEMARERMRVTAATYRGEDSKGQRFVINAGSAVQTSSRDPVVRMDDLSAQITMAEGPATLVANQGSYDMNKEVVQIIGPMRFAAADGYRLDTRDVSVGLKTRQIVSGGAVQGRMPLGTFSAGRMRADLVARTVTLEGRAHLHIDQGAIR